LGNDKLIEKEKNETESVKLAVYFDYARAAGWLLSAGGVFLYFLFQGDFFQCENILF